MQDHKKPVSVRLSTIKDWQKLHILKFLIASTIATLFALGCTTQIEADTILTEESEQADFSVKEVVKGLDHPWALAFLPDGDILITERSGQLRIVKNGELVPDPVQGLPDIYASGQGGLLDIALHPAFSDNQLLYLSYSARDKTVAGTEIARAKIVNGALQEVQTIFSVEPKTSGRNHYGSRFAFAQDGTLLITIGDRYSFMQEAQNPSNHLGSIIRIRDDGSIPKDNPFINDPNARPEVFSYGHRNPQGLTIRPDKNQVWSHEHGPRGGDEVNIIRAGANYGWPAITYGIDYGGAIISEFTEAPGMEQPVVYWDPSIAPSGMTFYTGSVFTEWQGDLFIGALKATHLRRLELEGDKVTGQEVLLKNLGERIRDVRQGPDGFLYVLTDSAKPNGRLLR
ncbi:MAG: PQQ-dependent sugar dehydrogenase, partial [Gammaproteobacteria bacterium]